MCSTSHVIVIVRILHRRHRLLTILAYLLLQLPSSSKVFNVQWSGVVYEQVRSCRSATCGVIDNNCLDIVILRCEVDLADVGQVHSLIPDVWPVLKQVILGNREFIQNSLRQSMRRVITSLLSSTKCAKLNLKRVRSGFISHRRLNCLLLCSLLLFCSNATNTICIMKYTSIYTTISFSSSANSIALLWLWQ